MLRVPLDRFTYHDGSLVTEASDLPRVPGLDEALAGTGDLVVVDGETEAPFRLSRVERDPREGETLSWTLRPTGPAMQHLIVRVFND